MKRSSAKASNVAGLVARHIANHSNLNDTRTNIASLRETSRNSKASVNSLVSQNQLKQQSLRLMLQNIDNKVKSFRNHSASNEEIFLYDHHPQYTYMINMKRYVNSADTKKALARTKAAIRTSIKTGNYNSGAKAYKAFVNDLISTEIRYSGL